MEHSSNVGQPDTISRIPWILLSFYHLVWTGLYVLNAT